MTVAAGVAASDSWNRVRADFPYLQECVYLNTAAAGVSWAGQGEAAAKFYDRAKARGFNGMERWREAARDARASIVQLLGVRDTEIDFVSSTTEGLNLVARAVRWRPGNEIVIAADEFPSVMLACEGVEQAGVRLRRIDIEAESDRESSLAAAVTSATRMMAVSHVHWATGTRLDLVRLSAACRRVGALLMVDGVQALGAVAVHLGDADVYCASVFKWLLSGFGLAILVVREGARKELTPVIRGYNNPAPSTELQYAHVNHPALFALAATLEYLEVEVGWDQVYARVDALTARLSARLRDRGFTVITPSSARAGIVSCSVADPVAVRGALAGQDIHVEEREGLLRVSPHFYNSPDEIDAFVEALARVV